MAKAITIQEIERIRSRGKGFLGTAAGLYSIRLFIALLAYEGALAKTLGAGEALGALIFGPILTGTAMAFTSFAFADLQKAWAKFYHRRYSIFVQQLLDEGYQVPWRMSMIRFYLADNLTAFEKTLLDGLASSRNAIDRRRQQERWSRANLRLRPQLEALLDEFDIQGLDRKRMTELFHTCDSPRKRREYLQSLGRKLAYEKWKNILEDQIRDTVVAVVETLPQSLEDIELRSMEVRAARVESSAAWAIYQVALSTSLRRDKIRLFGEALRIDDRESEKEERVGTSQSTPKIVQRAEVKQICLQEFARDRLSVMQKLLPLNTNWQMCREIVLFLLEPGRSGGRFNKHYRAEDSVKVAVRRQYQVNTGRNFDPKEFEEAIEILLACCVLVTKPKTDERTVSLSTRTKNAATPEAAEIIVAVLKLKRELGGFA